MLELLLANTVHQFFLTDINDKGVQFQSVLRDLATGYAGCLLSDSLMMVDLVELQKKMPFNLVFLTAEGCFIAESAQVRSG